MCPTCSVLIASATASLSAAVAARSMPAEVALMFYGTRQLMIWTLRALSLRRDSEP